MNSKLMFWVVSLGFATIVQLALFYAIQYFTKRRLRKRTLSGDDLSPPDFLALSLVRAEGKRMDITEDLRVKCARVLEIFRGFGFEVTQATWDTGVTNSEEILWASVKLKEALRDDPYFRTSWHSPLAACFRGAWRKRIGDAVKGCNETIKSLDEAADQAAHDFIAYYTRVDRRTRP